MANKNKFNDAYPRTPSPNQFYDRQDPNLMGQDQTGVYGNAGWQWGQQVLLNFLDLKNF